MTWSGGVWPRSKIPTKSSLIRKRFTLGRNSAREHCFRKRMHDSARRGSKPGSLSPQRKRRRPPTSRAAKVRPACRNRPHRYTLRIARAGRKATTLRITAYRTGTRGPLRLTRKLTTERILARFVYDDYKTSSGAGVSDVRHNGAERGEGDAALLERPGGLSWQGRSDDHGGVSAGQLGPDTSPQRTRVCLCA